MSRCAVSNGITGSNAGSARTLMRRVVSCILYTKRTFFRSTRTVCRSLSSLNRLPTILMFASLPSIDIFTKYLVIASAWVANSITSIKGGHRFRSELIRFYEQKGFRRGLDSSRFLAISNAYSMYEVVKPAQSFSSRATASITETCTCGGRTCSSINTW